MKKTISLPIAVIIILICAGLTGWVIVTYYLEIPEGEEKITEIKPPEGEEEEEEEDETADWKTYRNEEYGFEIECPLECEVNSSAILRKFGNDVIGYGLFKCEKGDKTMSIDMAISPEFIFYMTGAGGYLHGKTFFKKDIERDRTRSEEKTFNGILFTEYYSIEYQGMGIWNRTINAISKNPSGGYYINFSIYLEGLGGLPDHFWIESPYSFSEEGKEWVFQNIKEEKLVKLFNQFLSNFKLID